MRSGDLVQHQRDRLVDAVERLLEVRKRPSASFEDLDQALDEVRVAFEVMRRIEGIAAVKHGIASLDPGDAGVVVPIRGRPHP